MAQKIYHDESKYLEQVKVSTLSFPLVVHPQLNCRGGTVTLNALAFMASLLVVYWWGGLKH